MASSGEHPAEAQAAASDRHAADASGETDGGRPAGGAGAGAGGGPEGGPAASASVLDLPEKALAKIHSVIRWGKDTEEVQAAAAAAGVSVADAAIVPDPKNGNRCLHIAAQNGHLELVKFLLTERPDAVNLQNNKGQTALHMSVEYDMYFQTKVLLESGADPTITNNDGHAAVTGIEGSKTGPNAWDNPVNVLKAAEDDPEQLDLALSLLEKADPSIIDKVQLAQAGLAKKRACKNHWNADRFKGIMQKL